MTQTFLDTSADPEKPETWEYDYYPNNFSEPYLSRRRKVGFDLYSPAGVERGDIEGSLRQYRPCTFQRPVGATHLHALGHQEITVATW